VNKTVRQSGRHRAVAVRAWPKRMPDGCHKGTRRMGYGVRTGLSMSAIYTQSTWPFRQRIFEHDIGLAEWARMHGDVALPSPRPCSRRVLRLRINAREFGYTIYEATKGRLAG
jgi:hypothetical protein